MNILNFDAKATHIKTENARTAEISISTELSSLHFKPGALKHDIQATIV